MNKFVKGSVAAGAGMVLLLGGAGSLAYWNTSTDLGASAIKAGTLDITAAAGTWSSTITEWVPGDASTYSTTLTLTAEGDNIEGTIVLDSDSIVVSPAAAGEFSFVLNQGAPATVTAVAGATGPVGVVAFDSATETFTFDGPGVYTIPVQLSVDFPFTSAVQATTPNNSQNATVDFSGVSFIATQTDAN
ncbi:alternate-type signal peptide domain-containing protein [Agrococcus citreus]|uniref:Alternate signal-mediated exported protein, RER_14450 family n=1 Tax=Agrococcus citreus TaxID=84643 RepID=A0ABN1YWY9_9MICO